MLCCVGLSRGLWLEDVRFVHSVYGEHPFDYEMAGLDTGGIMQGVEMRQGVLR